MNGALAGFGVDFGRTVWSIAVEAGPWVLLSLVAGGLVHEFVPSSRLGRLLDRRGMAGLAGAVLLGALLPICSCGVVPLAVSFYRSGLRTGAVMAFTAATPIINPAAVILSLALLGPRITAAYVLLGLVLPVVLGLAAERWGEGPVGADAGAAAVRPLPLEASPPDAAFGRRVLRALRWGMLELGPSIGFYLLVGVLLAALVMASVPQSWIAHYLGGSSLLGLAAVALFGASIYVCAVANIPVAATLLAAGAGPGAAIVFLVTGTATNLPELLALYHTIGKRTVIIYASALVAASFVAGMLVNAWLLPGFAPAFDPLRGLDGIAASARWQPTVSAALATASVYLLAVLGCWGGWLRIRQRLGRRRDADGCGGGCCGAD
ncbi:MAG TPA: permease [Gammaproteobacteria bacterium]|nr:permease [Gammaproteobacteria bacterium]